MTGDVVGDGDDLTRLVGVIADAANRHIFIYQDIGPIHYICVCREPHTQFISRSDWETHQAEQIVEAVLPRIKDERDRLVERVREAEAERDRLRV